MVKSLLVGIVLFDTLGDYNQLYLGTNSYRVTSKKLNTVE